MLEITCFHCGQVVQISPDAERCSECGTNLRKFIGREQASNYFYVRAADYAGSGNVLAALQEVQRGITFVNTSELHLLGAILCKRLGRWEDMRHFVAAIPADDPLRGEGEWLLRSNQARQRPAPSPVRGKAPVAIPVIPDSDALPLVLDEISPSRNRAKSQPSSRGLAVLVSLTLVVVLAGAGWIAWENDLFGAAPLPGLQAAGQAASQSAEADTPPVNASAPSAADEPAVEPPAPADAAQPAEPALSVPTPTISPNLAVATPSAKAVVSADEAGIAQIAASSPFDLRAWLEGRGRSDLAALPVTARQEGITLTLEGTVEYAEQRATLEFEARQAPGITDVSLANVTLDTPETYTVAEGDSLWAISVRVYGNPDQVEELFAANNDKMVSASDLSVGMVLTLPPLQ